METTTNDHPHFVSGMEDSGMKFLIRRTSLWNDDVPPCGKCTQETFTKVEMRTVPTPEAFDKKFGEREGLWLSKGTNHGKFPGGIKRDHPHGAKGWFREFDTLDDLIAFTDEHGTIVIGWSMWNDDVRQIEIYDDYRE